MVANGTGMGDYLYFRFVKHPFVLRLPASPTKTGLYFDIMAQEKRETRFCQVHQTIGIAKHPLRNELKKQIPHARFYPNQMLYAPY